jgi:hypothetical protein
MKRILVVGLGLLLGATALSAQTRKVIPEFRPFAGMAIPTGDQRTLFKDAPMFGLQGAMEVRPYLHALGTFGWIVGQDKYQIGNNDVNILNYNLGVELGPVASLAKESSFMPFVGVGGGARTYLYSGTGLSDRTCTAGYAAVGAEIKVGATAFRLEGRDNLFCYRSPISGIASETRNEIGLTAGLAYHLR